MYGNSMRGVRISLPDDLFEWQLLNAYHQVPGTDAMWQFDNAEAPFSLDDVFGEGNLLLPMIDRTRIFKEVCYVTAVAAAYKQHIKNDGVNNVNHGNPAGLAREKRNRRV